MARALLVNPYPYGVDVTQRLITVSGSIALAGSAVTTGEPIDWTVMSTGIGYNEINFAGNGVHGNATALTTGFAVSAGVCTCTAVNNFSVGQVVTFAGNTQTLSALFNGVPVQIVSCSSSQFTFNTAQTGTTTTGDVGIAYTAGKVLTPSLSGPSQTVTVSALSASGTTLTVTGANTLLPGALVTVSVATGTLGPKLTMQVPVLNSTGTAFTAQMPSALTGTTGTGTATGSNPPQPYSVKFWSALASGYIYQYNSTFGTLFVQTSAGFTPAGTNSAPTITTSSGGVAVALGVAAGALSEVTGATGITGVQAPVFTGTAVTAAVLSNLAAAAYPAGVLADCIKWEARFMKDR